MIGSIDNGDEEIISDVINNTRHNNTTTGAGGKDVWGGIRMLGTSIAGTNT